MEERDWQYQWSDAWLLQAIIEGDDNGAGMYTIISMGDALNHAIFSDDELESGLARLTGGGLVSEKESRFFATEVAQEMYSKAGKKGSGTYAIREALAGLMQAEDYDSVEEFPNPKNNLSYPGFSPEAVAEAIQKWHEDAREMMKKK